MLHLRSRALNLIFPPECARCRAPTANAFGLCGPCWGDTAFITGPACDTCGLPILAEGPANAPLRCESCTRHPPAWDRGRAAVLYEGAARDVVLRFKHADRLDLAAVLARWLARAGSDLIAEAEIIAPVPLHWTRLVRRRANQAAELVRRPELGAGARAVPDLLTRARRTPTLKGTTREARHATLQGAIAATPRHCARLVGARVLLIDDVMTTGATLSAAAEACRAAGAARVNALTIARVAPDDVAYI